jgi:hypothetical protein
VSRALTEAEQAHLLEASKVKPRDNLLFHVALSGPLFASDIVTIELGDVVASDEKTIMDACMVVTHDARRARREDKEFFLCPAAREVAATVVNELRDRCPHSSKGAMLGDYYDTRGVLRCYACDLRADWRFWPLFQTWRGRRMTDTACRQRFEHWRRALRWPEKVGFESLRETFETRARAALRKELGGRRDAPNATGRTAS